MEALPCPNNLAIYICVIRELITVLAMPIQFGTAGPVLVIVLGKQNQIKTDSISTKGPQLPLESYLSFTPPSPVCYVSDVFR